MIFWLKVSDMIPFRVTFEKMSSGIFSTCFEAWKLGKLTLCSCASSCFCFQPSKREETCAGSAIFFPVGYAATKVCVWISCWSCSSAVGYDISKEEAGLAAGLAAGTEGAATTEAAGVTTVGVD
jgi:hypothetical protein